jgi:hypothetical protein
MAEIRNTFVKSKMNKDLDDRLLSKGEYRNAENVQISRSEGEDVGALENVLGNNLITNWGLNSISNLEIIGYTLEQAGDRAFFIATNYTDVSDSEIDNAAPYGASCYILMLDNKASDSASKYKILVQGRFLNFSKTHPVYGIDLIEDLLFWTDNRNQPRKINITRAIESVNYYTNEEQISVAKFNPYNAPVLYESKVFEVSTPSGVSTLGPHRIYDSGPTSPNELKVGMFPFTGVGSQPDIDPTTGVPRQVSRGPDPGATGYKIFYTNIGSNFGTTSSNYSFFQPSSKDVVSQYLPPSTQLEVSAVSGATIAYDCATYGAVGDVLTEMLLHSIRFNPSLGVTVVSHNVAGCEITFSQNVQTLGVATNDIIQLAWPNPYWVSSWPGDKDFLKDKFVRFAYRFKFDDGEYSLISTFTQAAFIPKQDGYIRSELSEFPYLPEPAQGTDDYQLRSQERDIRDSTIVSFFENKINEVIVKIDTPYPVNQLADKLKIKEIDILYKESDGLAIQVLETIPVTDGSITSNSTNVYNYQYQSRKPFRTLPERETLRVFDKVPIRALTQSVTGNRVIYGNFIDKHTPPQNLDYNVRISPKINVGSGGTSILSYPKHTIKENRNYQVGIILSDKYGRQSDVILSSITNFQFVQGTATSEPFDGSTVFNPYKQSSPNSGTDKWFGDSIKILFRNAIPETANYAVGYPGIYKSGKYTGTVSLNSTGTLIKFSSLDKNIAVGDVVTGTDSGGAFIDSVAEVDSPNNQIRVNQNHSLVIGDVLEIYGPENKLGWYTYKIVVKQQAEEYYNAYLPSLAQGDYVDDDGTISKDKSTSYTPLISDNINKIPSDLTEVQPEQTQFRTSDKILFPRVGPAPSDNSSGIVVGSAGQYYIDTQFVTADTIAKVTDLAIQDLTPTVTGKIEIEGIYQAKSNPTVARLSNNQTNIGGDVSGSGGDTNAQQLAIFEVKPATSRIDIYWETSTTGLVSELNEAIGGGGASNPLEPEDPNPPAEQ